MSVQPGEYDPDLVAAIEAVYAPDLEVVADIGEQLPELPASCYPPGATTPRPPRRQLPTLAWEFASWFAAAAAIALLVIWPR